MYQKASITYNPQSGELTINTAATAQQNINNIVTKWNRVKQSYKKLTTSDLNMDFVFHADKNDYEKSSNYNNGSLTKTHYDFAQRELKRVQGNTLAPIIHIFPYDIFMNEDVYRYKKIVDSSIWNHYIVIEKGKTLEQLKNVIKQIGVYCAEKRYSLNLTYEYCDFHSQLVDICEKTNSGPHADISPFLFHSESEMQKIIDNYKNKVMHDTSLPTILKYRWRFLLLDDKSGEKMSDYNNAQIDICKLQIVAHDLCLLGFGENQIWFRVPEFKPVREGSFLPNNSNSDNRILDDNQRIIEYKEINGKREKVEPFMKYVGRVKNGKFVPGQPKFQVDFETPDNTDDIQIVIDCVKHVDAAQYCLQKYKYEIVLLDYLLYKDKIAGDKEYGYQLLERLNIWHQEKLKRAKDKKPDAELDNIYHPGPNGRFFFLFISAYTTAVHERMLEKGFGKTERGLWFLGDGACPTNTPYLFAYRLLLLMRYRIKDLSLDNEGGFLSLIDLLKEIFVNTDPRDKLTDVRERAHKHFNHVLFMRDKYKKLENDLLEEDEKSITTGEDIINMRSSLLIQSAFQRVHLFSGSFFEHLQHLVYLTAFGTIRQWTELWEEYVFIHKTLLRYDDLTGGSDGLTINQAIRDYIIQLKENSN